MAVIVVVVILHVLVAVVTGAPPTFDGIIRNATDGTLEAYMKPPFPANHASAIEPCPNGDLALAWFSGSSEGKSKVSIVLSLLLKGANQWTNPAVVSQRDGFSNQNPVLFYDSQSNTLFLFHSQQAASSHDVDGEETATIWELQSSDCGRSWTAPRLMFSKPGSFDRNRIIVSLKNAWLFPIYYQGGSRADTSYLKESTSHNVFGYWQEFYFTGSDHLIQPTVVRPNINSTKLVAFFRDRQKENIYSSISLNDGVTWSKATKTTLPNNDSGIQATVLHSGHLAMVYNPTTGPRNPLMISVSKDEGQTWSASHIIEFLSHQSAEFSYPSLFQDSLGRIHVSYTFKRETIKYKIIPNEEWIFKQDL